MLLLVQLLIGIMTTSTLAIFQDFKPVLLNDALRAKAFEDMKKIEFLTGSTNITAKLRERIVLTCTALGIPGPTIHWLKNGVRMSRSNSSIIPSSPNMTFYDIAITVSNLHLNCITKDSAAVYTCVAETTLARNYQNHTLDVDTSATLTNKPKCTFLKSIGFPAKIFMYTMLRMEYMRKEVRLYCRANGVPRPIITWFNEKKKKLKNGKLYRLANNGDLIIKKTTLAREGQYKCQARNFLNSDSQVINLNIFKVTKNESSKHPTKPSNSPFSVLRLN